MEKTHIGDGIFREKVKLGKKTQQDVTFEVRALIKSKIDASIPLMRASMSAELGMEFENNFSVSTTVDEEKEFSFECKDDNHMFVYQAQVTALMNSGIEISFGGPVVTSSTPKPFVSEDEDTAMPDGNEVVNNGDEVYIEVNNEQLWLAEQPCDTYCAAAGPESSRAKFRVHKSAAGIRLQYVTHPGYYLGDDYLYLYAATTGSAKYDQRSGNTKQLWCLNNQGDIDLRYNTPVKLMDRYVDSYLAVNTTASASDYSGGANKVWVEAKYKRHLTANFRNEFVVHKVP